MNDIADASAAMNERRGVNEEVLLSSLRRTLKSGKGNRCNIGRNMVRTMLKSTQWPGLYVQDVRCWCPKADAEKSMPLAFLLPHEVIGAIVSASDLQTLLSTVSMDPLSHAHLTKCEAEAGCKLLGLGIWGDGVPCQWDRNESVDVLSLNLPGVGDSYENLIIPITALPHGMLSTNTWDDILAVVKRSLVALAVGRYWNRRADGHEDWRTDKAAHASDAKRAKLANKSIGLRAALVEVRGDWKFFKDVFRFPAWNEKAGCCWICPCIPDQVCVG